jgi:hypothetical protein
MYAVGYRFMRAGTLIALVLTAWAISANAAAPPKWIIFGFTGDGDQGRDAVFFDQAGIKRLPQDHVQVWMKSLSEKKLDHITSISFSVPPKKGTPDYDEFYTYLPSALARMKSGEPLLYESVATVKLDANTRDSMKYYEAAANSGAIEAHIKMLYEVDCPKNMVRYLSLSILKENGDLSTTDTPEAWAPVPPGSNGSRLAMLVCKPQ